MCHECLIWFVVHVESLVPPFDSDTDIGFFLISRTAFLRKFQKTFSEKFRWKILKTISIFVRIFLVENFPNHVRARVIRSGCNTRRLVHPRRSPPTPPPSHKNFPTHKLGFTLSLSSPTPIQLLFARTSFGRGLNWGILEYFDLGLHHDSCTMNDRV